MLWWPDPTVQMSPESSPCITSVCFLLSPITPLGPSVPFLWQGALVITVTQTHSHMQSALHNVHTDAHKHTHYMRWHLIRLCSWFCPVYTVHLLISKKGLQDTLSHSFESYQSVRSSALRPMWQCYDPHKHMIHYETLQLFTQMLFPSLTDAFKIGAVAIVPPLVTTHRRAAWFRCTPFHFDCHLLNNIEPICILHGVEVIS